MPCALVWKLHRVRLPVLLSETFVADKPERGNIAHHGKLLFSILTVKRWLVPCYVCVGVKGLGDLSPHIAYTPT